MKAILRERIFIEVNDVIRSEIEKELTYTIPVRISASEVRNVKLFDFKRVSSTTLSIPIGREDLIPDGHEILDKRVYNMTDFHIQEGITLRDSQQEIYDNIEDNTIINAGCSFGKTFTGLALAEKLGQKTLIIVHTLKLMDQWVKEIDKVLGTKPGIIGKGEFNTSPDICIATNQTLVKKADKDLYNLFGTVIVDECHHIPATTFNSIVDKFRARYKIGLSATLRRKDMKQFLITNYITHDNIIKPATENSMTPSVVVIKTNIHMPNGNSWQERVSKLVENDEYIALIYSTVLELVNKGYSVLTISNRVGFLEKLHNNTPDSGLIIGGRDDTDEVIQNLLDGLLTSVYGSTQIMSEGISVNVLSAVVLGTPINSDITLEQVIGRIIRLHNGKKDPVVMDIVLKGQTAANQFRTRKQYYMSKGYAITEIQL